jgi:hypothetical protein
MVVVSVAWERQGKAGQKHIGGRTRVDVLDKFLGPGPDSAQQLVRRFSLWDCRSAD